MRSQNIYSGLIYFNILGKLLLILIHYNSFTSALHGEQHIEQHTDMTF